MVPDRTISAKPMICSKKDKKRMTLLVYANYSRSEKITIILIINVLRSRYFKNKTGQEHVFDYASNKNAWILWPLSVSG